MESIKIDTLNGTAKRRYGMQPRSLSWQPFPSFAKAVEGSFLASLRTVFSNRPPPSACPCYPAWLGHWIIIGTSGDRSLILPNAQEALDDEDET
jgi:hypothetical protein